jgi:HK97 gp10 family phage protein
MGIEVVYVGNFKEVLNALDETAKKRMMEAAREVHKQTVENLTGNRSGRMYYVPGTHKKYQASSEAEMPASATGTLRKTVQWGVEGDGISLTGYVGSDQKYAPMLEFGTKNMRPRRWLGLTFEKMEDKIQEIFRRVWF